MIRRSSWILGVALLAFCSAANALEPANPKANPKVKAILNYFDGLRSRSDKRVVAGQFIGAGQGMATHLADQIHDRSGQWPAFIGVDYVDYQTGGLTHTAPNAAALQYWKQGGLVAISTHLYNPADPNGGGQRDQGVDLNALLTPGTDTYTRWMHELNQIAEGLTELKQAGVVVLWRPFHEMNGDWFWWGRKDPELFIRVWRQMFDYFSTTKSLDNLIWVYSPNHGEKTAAYYAGDHYVDLVGLDAYTDFLDPEHVRGYDDVVKLPKPFGFTEYGPHGPTNPPGDYDYTQFLEGVSKNFPRTVFFMSWDARWSMGRNNKVKELLNSPQIVTRADLPSTLVPDSR